MIKRIIVAGCRDYDDYNGAKEFIEICIKKIREKYTLVFLSGGCKGADMKTDMQKIETLFACPSGERYAIENSFPMRFFAIGILSGSLEKIRQKRWPKTKFTDG